MGVAVSASFALTAVQALLRYRARVDEILVVKEAAAPLPFLLPPVPPDPSAQLDAMRAFFKTERGRALLVVEGRTEVFDQIDADPFDPALADELASLYAFYFAASDAVPSVLGPPPAGGGARPIAPRESQDLRLAYYVVRSARLSNNPAAARLLLAAADTLLEVAGQNAELFVSNPKTRAVVETILDEFAVQRDFDDASAGTIVRQLLASTVVAAAEHGADLSDAPVLGVFFGALADVRQKMDDEAAQTGQDFVAGILSADGFQQVVAAFLTNAADDPSFITQRPALKAVLSTTLREAGETLPAITQDPRALFGVLEAAVGAAGQHATELLGRKLAGKPLLTAVAAAVGTKISEAAQSQALIDDVVTGRVFGDVFRAAVGAVAAHPDELSEAAGLDALTTQLVAGVADVLSHKALTDVISVESLREIVSRGLTVLADHPDALGVDSEYATKVLVAVLKASSDAIVDGLALEDLGTVANAALGAATSNLRLLESGDTLFALLEATGTALSTQGVEAVLTPKGRRDVLADAIGLVAANPRVWEQLRAGDLMQPIVAAVAEGLSKDGTKLLSGPVYVAAMRGVLLAAARRGRRFTDDDVSAPQLQTLIELGLAAAEDELGRTLDGENVAEFLRRVVSAFLTEPFQPLSADNPRLKSLISETALAVAA